MSPPAHPLQWGQQGMYESCLDFGKLSSHGRRPESCSQSKLGHDYLRATGTIPLLGPQCSSEAGQQFVYLMVLDRYCVGQTQMVLKLTLQSFQEQHKPKGTRTWGWVAAVSKYYTCFGLRSKPCSSGKAFFMSASLRCI